MGADSIGRYGNTTQGKAAVTASGPRARRGPGNGSQIARDVRDAEGSFFGDVACEESGGQLRLGGYGVCFFEGSATDGCCDAQVVVTCAFFIWEDDQPMTGRALI